MANPSPEYRTDHLACPLNAGKLEKVRDLVLAMRKVAKRESVLQWRQFHLGRWQSFESMATKGWTRPWVKDETLNTTFSQLVMSQVAGSLKGHFGNVQNTFALMVSGSSLPPPIRHQLHFINRRKAWFWQCDVKVKQTVERVNTKGKVILREVDVIVSQEVRDLARTLIRKALSRHRKPHFNRFQPQLDQRSCFIQSAHTANQPLWLAMSTLGGKERISLPLIANQAFLDRNAQSGLYQALAKPEELQASPTGDGQGFLVHLLAKEDKAPKVRNPHPSKLSLPNTVRLLLSENQSSLTIGVVSDMQAAFEHQASTYSPLRSAVFLDTGLCTLFGTDDGELHGRGWMETLLKFDALIASIARHRQRLGLKVASDRYRFHVNRLRGWIKTEIHRVLNRLVERKRPAAIILEALDFRSPDLSRRMNRLLQNFGKGVITRKLAEVERQYGITVEYRDAAYTSSQCNRCGYVDKRNRKQQSKFQCRFCNKSCHADVQAPRVLRDRRSVATSFSGSRMGRKQLLIELVSQFNERYTRPRGGPADPRFTNPYFTHWAKAQRVTMENGCLAEVTPGLGSPVKKAA